MDLYGTPVVLDILHPMTWLRAKQMKSILKKCDYARSDPHTAILEFINTPSNLIGLSPAKRLFDRDLRSIHPTDKKLLLLKNASLVLNLLRQSKEKQKLYYNKHVKHLGELELNKHIVVEPYGNHLRSIPGKMTDKQPSEDILYS